MDDGIPFPAGNNLPALVPYSEWPRSEWDRPFNHGLFKEREHYLVTVHSFEAGGFEATVRHVDLQKMMDLAMLPRGIRKPPAERDPLGVLRAVNRAKKTLRHCVKTIGATHLLTLTTREKVNTPESLELKLKKWVRGYRKLSGDAFLYVAVVERHPTNPDLWHLHVAVRGWFPD